MQYPFKQVDVFTKVAYLGNPVAVVLEAEGLAAEQMRQIAAWTNLSVLPALRAISTGRSHSYPKVTFKPPGELPVTSTEGSSCTQM